MKTLLHISQTYDELGKQYMALHDAYFAEKTLEDFIQEQEKGITPEWLTVRKDREAMVPRFVAEAFSYGKRTNLTVPELLTRIVEQVLQPTPKVNEFLLINLMGEIGKQPGRIPLGILEKLILNHLEAEEVGGV